MQASNLITHIFLAVQLGKTNAMDGNFLRRQLPEDPVRVGEALFGSPIEAESAME